jgi:hypothetical protein
MEHLGQQLLLCQTIVVISGVLIQMDILEKLHQQATLFVMRFSKNL